MKKINFNQSKAGNLLKGKGFYVALCASIVTVGAAGIFAYNQTAQKLKSQLDSTIPNTTSQTEEWDYNDFAENANAEQDSIPEETTAPVTTAAPKQTEKNVQTAAQPLIMPLNGEVINPFSNGELVKSKTLNIWKTHDGTDIKGTLGDQVKSMTSGKVVDVKEDPLWGVCVVIDHGNGFEGYYYNLNKVIPVKVDQKVSAGTVIGAIGDTAQCEVAEASHLHFGLKKNGSWVDPIKTINPNS